MKKEPDYSRNKIPDTILIAGLTASGYLATFAYQYSYLKYYNVPIFLLEVNIELILMVTSIGLLWLMSTIMIYDFLYEWKPVEKHKKIMKTLILIANQFLIPAIFIIYDPKHIWISFILFLIILIILILLIVKKHKNTKSSEETGKNQQPIHKMMHNYSKFSVMSVYMMILFMIYSLFIGRSIAKNKTEYLVSNTNPQLMIISTYKNSFIGLTFSTTTSQFDKNIMLLEKEKISSDKITLSSENIGIMFSNHTQTKNFLLNLLYPY